MNSSSENFDSVFNSLESFENMNAPLTENFSWIKPVARPTYGDGVYCGIPQEKAFAKYENRNFTSVTSDYGFNQPDYNQKSYMKFKSGESKLQNFHIPIDKNRGYTTTESPSGFSDLEPIKGLYRDVTAGSTKTGTISSKGLSSPASEYSDFRKSTNKPSSRVTVSSPKTVSSSKIVSSPKTVSTKQSVASSIVKSIYFPKTSSVSAPKTTSSAPKTTSSAPTASVSVPKTTSSAPKTTSSAPTASVSAPKTTSSAPKTSSVSPVTTSSAPKTASSKVSSSPKASSVSAVTTSSAPQTSSSKLSSTVSTKSSKK